MMNKSISFFLSTLAVMLLFAGCGSDAPSKKTVISLAQRCTLAGIQSKQLSDPRKWGEWQDGATGKHRELPGVEEKQFSITNSFTQTVNNEKVYCYDVKWKYGTSGSDYNAYRISIVKRGNSLEVVGFRCRSYDII